MRTRELSTSLLIAFIFCLGLNKANATHAAGMEIFYRWTQDSTYEFTVTFYRNCDGFTAGAPQNVVLNSSSISTNQNYSTSLGMLPIFGTGVPPIHPPNMYNCAIGTYCVEEYVYRGLWTSSKRASDWIFSYAMCCLPNTGAPANMQNGTLFNEAGLNNLDFPDGIDKNMSPIFHNRRPNHPGFLTDTLNNPAWLSVCEGRSIHLSQAVRNYDNDYIKYEMFVPQTNGGAPNTYINGYTFNNPMPTRTGLGFDTINGMMNFTAGAPTGTGIYLLGIKATEYRNDTVLILGVPTVIQKEIGFVKRNLFLIIEDSTTCPDATFEFKDSTQTAAATNINLKCDDNPFRVEFKRRVLCNSIDSNGSHLLIINALTQDTIDVVNSYSKDCSSNLTTNGFSVYLDSALEGGNYYLMFKQGDDGNTMLTDCYRELTPFADTLSISVTPAAPLGVLMADTSTGSPDTLELECNAQDFSVFLTEQFRCNSVKSNGSDFQLYNLSTTPPTIENISKANTTGACFSGMSTQVNLKTYQLLAPGYYELFLVRGTDGNSLLNYCRKNFDTTSIIIKVNDISLDLGADIVYCKNSGWDTTLASPFWASYSWSTGSFAPWITVDTAGTYWLKVYTNAGCFTSDTIVVAEKDCFIGIDENNAIERFHIYPNPSNGLVYIQSSQLQGNEEVVIYELQGRIAFRQILERSNNLSEFDLNELNRGIYLIQVLRNGEILQQEKLVLKGY